ncbi:tryptophan synthase subunit alpha [Aerococcus urinaeequi]|uniref:tryptophan synthase subunit alpha n=1 Tax=Aerococcus urinaeequi TaxID=51665 RepID=UPI003D6A8AEB
MSKIAEAFQNKKAFITYLMAGDPNLDQSAENILAAQEAGADLIEIGIPFSDPIAEGPVVENASVRALSAGVRLNNVFDMVADLKDKIHVPLVFMTYLNLVFVYGYDNFFAKCQEIGISGIIIPDLPFEEQEEVKVVASQYSIEVITLIAPTSKDRIKKIAKKAEGFIYLVSSMGVTGVRSSITTDISAMVAEIRAVSDIPVAVGFGINQPSQVKDIAAKADGVIVGSGIVRLVEAYGEEAKPHIYDYVHEMQAVLR